MVEQAQLINTTNASRKRHKTVRTVLTDTRSADHEGFERRKRSKKSSVLVKETPDYSFHCCCYCCYPLRSQIA